MDDELTALLDLPTGPAPAEEEGKHTTSEHTFRFADRAAGVVQVTAGEMIHNYTLKPLSQLYGPGTGLDSIDTSSMTFLPLLLTIEEVFHKAAADPRVTDAAVAFALDRLCMSPEANVGNDVLAREVQLQLRLSLSLNDYSRQDVRHALRKVAKSVARHTKLDGPRGYLKFIREQLGG